MHLECIVTTAAYSNRVLAPNIRTAVNGQDRFRPKRPRSAPKSRRDTAIAVTAERSGKEQGVPKLYSE